ADRGGAQAGDGAGGDRAEEACAIQGGDDTGAGELGGGELGDLSGAQTTGGAVEAALIWAALRFCTCVVVRLDNVVPPAATRLPIAEVEMLEMSLVEIACRLVLDRSPNC